MKIMRFEAVTVVVLQI